MSTFVIDLIIQTEVATPVYSHVDIFDAVEKTLQDDLRPAFPGKAVAFRYTPTSPLPAGAATLTDKHLVGVVFEVDDLRLLNNGYIKRYNPYPDSPAAAAKYEKHTELKGHELKYDQAKCAAAKYEKHTELKDHESKYDQAKYAAGQHTQHPPSQYPLASVKSRKARQKGKHRANLNAHVKALNAENRLLKIENHRLANELAPLKGKGKGKGKGKE